MELPSPPRPAPNNPGAAAEAEARRFLQAQGFEFVAANYRCRFGEIDLVMRQATLLVFAEVRLRNRQDFGGAAASVTRAKQQKIIASAGAFLHHHPEFSRCNCRFDVLALQACAQEWHIDWLVAAFTT
ncbi:MAG: YraN family protein [Moraxellaceae bacterium]